MWDVFNSVATNVGVSFENIVTLIVMLAGFISYSRGFQVGIITHFVLSAALFVWFYSQGLLYKVPLLLFFVSLVIMCLSLYAMAKESPQGGFV